MEARTIFENYFKGSPDQQKAFDQFMIWLQQNNDDGALKEYLEGLWLDWQIVELENQPDWEKMLNDILSAKLVKRRRISFWKIAAASVIALLFAGGIYFYRTAHVRSTEPSRENLAGDIKAPSMNRATITLSGGQKIFLDSAANGLLTRIGTVEISKKQDGELVYNGKASAKSELLYNILSNPRGSKVISLTLSDGTKVWLNAESSLRYPVTFGRDERKVEVAGEAYFEVAHNDKLPFRVNSGKATIEDIGTAFNVQNYSDEAEQKITLVSGSVNIDHRTILKPGEQQVIEDNGNQHTIRGVDTGPVLAWKNGYFQFAGTGVREIMRQIARWYDVEIFYEGQVPEIQFGGELERAADLSQTLKILEEYNLHFKLKEKKLIVMP